MLRIKNCKIISGNSVLEKYLYIKNGIIFAITNEELPFDSEIDGEGLYASPGFIDIHSHGGGGYDFMDGGFKPIERAAKAHFVHGTTTIYPTGLTASNQCLKNFINDVKKVMSLDGIPHIPGLHLEGPYFSYEQRGAQNPRYLRNPDKKEYAELINMADGAIKRISYAPELPGAEELTDYLSEKGIVAALGHTEAFYDDILKVYNKGCHLATHLYSGMSGVKRVGGFRKLGAVESSLLLDDMYVEVIADGLHLPPELLKLIYKVKGSGKTILVTDSMRGAGMAEGPSTLGPKEEGIECIIENGIAWMTDRTGFAGSVATSDRLVRTMYKLVGIDIVNSIKMITETPAKIMGLKNTGSLIEGFDADIVIFDDDINVKYIIKKEKKAWKSESVRIHKN
ncbi:MAG: N-acetylglucosamine-6-phosphate deacetylase [Bacillota bacterium]|nr:N-acetylglucosamine-6-phosphate deacetylase [Bacillota bacterium]